VTCPAWIARRLARNPLPSRSTCAPMSGHMVMNHRCRESIATGAISARSDATALSQRSRGKAAIWNGDRFGRIRESLYGSASGWRRSCSLKVCQGTSWPQGSRSTCQGAREIEQGPSASTLRKWAVSRPDASCYSTCGRRRVVLRPLTSRVVALGGATPLARRKPLRCRAHTGICHFVGRNGARNTPLSRP
jgi:hypothetical protein